MIRLLSLVALALLGVACGQIETEVSAAPPISLPPTTTTTVPVEWLTFDSSVSAPLFLRTHDAVNQARTLGFGSTCSGLTVAISDDLAGHVGVAWGSSPGAPCGIEIDDEVAVDTTWYGDYVVYHEVAHIFTAEPEPHGLRFRRVEAALLATVDIEARYVTDSEYPDEYWVAGTCAYGCEEN